MAQIKSIRFRLLSAFFLGFLLVVVLGSLSLWRLASYHEAAAHIRDVYLPNTQFFGDLNNFTSDFRAAEATALLSPDAQERETDAVEIERLDERIALAEHSFEHVPNIPGEIDLYRGFVAKWQAYRAIADRVMSLSGTSRQAEATALYGSESRRAYEDASDALGVLTERNRNAARDANLRADSAYGQALWLILAGVMLSLAMLLFGLIYFRRSMLMPLLRLARTMHRLADQDMEVEIDDIAREDEIGEMARAVRVFHANAVELAVNQRALAEQASLLGEKLAHEKRLTEFQRNFVSMASHEIRTPLTIIDGEAQRLINTRNRATPQTVAERAETIRQAVSRMVGVIANLNESARLIQEGAELFVHPAEFDLALLLREVFSLYRTIAPHAQILEQIGQQKLTMVGDQKLLFQLFSNVMSNAVKYSSGRCLIRVAAERKGDQTVVSISDKGVGIPAQDIERLFELHFRGSNVSGAVGTGIGLYLVKTVADLHGGAVAVESTVGAGSTVRVSLPVVPAGYRA